jgi:membrane fusion protein
LTDLFRPEALEGQRLAWLGSIQLIRAPSLTVLTVLVVAATAAVIGFLMLGEYTRKARVNGYLVPDRGVIRLLAPRASTVIESHVGEGKAVEQGDVLFVLSVEQPTLEGASQQAVKSSLAARERSLMLASRQQQQLEQSRLAALDQQIEQMRSEQRQMAAEA